MTDTGAETGAERFGVCAAIRDWENHQKDSGAARNRSYFARRWGWHRQRAKKLLQRLERDGAKAVHRRIEASIVAGGGID